MRESLTSHWDYRCDFNENEWFGFVYEIYNQSLDKYYIGKKQFSFKNKDSKYRKPSKWEQYTGSCIPLNEDIQIQGKSDFIFTILNLQKTKSALLYAEVVEIVKRDAIIREDYYNSSIPEITISIEQYQP